MKRSGFLRIAPDADRLTVPAPRKPSKCTICRELYVKRSMTHKACGPECAAIVAQRKREKAERQALAVRKEALKTLADYKAETQVEVNKYIRLRDADLPCISCGRHHRGQYHAGHYKSVGAHPELRFNELNIHKQCKPCNTDKSGNILEFRKGLIAKPGFGIAVVDFLEGPHAPAHYSKEDCLRIKAEYKAKTKLLLQQKETAGAC